MKRALVVVALLAACGNDRRDAPAPTASRKVVQVTQPAGPSLAELIASAELATDARFDGATLGGSVAVYLVTAYGGRGLYSGQNADVALLVVGDQRRVRIAAGTFLVPAVLPFGTLIAAGDRTDDLPALDEPEPVLRATILADQAQNTQAYALIRRGDALLLYHHSASLGDWFPAASVTLAPGAIVSLPEPPAPRPAVDPIVVSLVERSAPWGSGKRLDTWLRIGDAAGALLGTDAPMDGSSWSDRQSTSLGWLPDGDLLACRAYASDGYEPEGRALTRDGDALVMWLRIPGGAWAEEVRVPIPRRARIDVQL